MVIGFGRSKLITLVNYLFALLDFHQMLDHYAILACRQLSFCQEFGLILKIIKYQCYIHDFKAYHQNNH